MASGPNLPRIDPWVQKSLIVTMNMYDNGCGELVKNGVWVT